MKTPDSWADWASILGFAWAVGASVAAWWQSHQRRAKVHGLVNFLHGLKTGVRPDQQEMIAQINDQLARLEPPKK